MKKLYTTLLLFCISNFVSAQNDFCLTDKIWAEMVRQDSSLYYRRMAEDEMIAKFTNDTFQHNTSGHLRSLSAENPVIIPTVVYIVHDGTPATNISMQQIQSQMDQLNLDFDSIGIQFCYAKRNLVDSALFVPQAGDSAGVIRISSPLTNVGMYTQEPQLKALSNLPSQNYLRIFVVKSITPSNVLGYAYYPGGSPALDGIVVRADAFGSRQFCPSCNFYPQYDFGATLTHEAGHYFNLYHTFNNGCYTGSGPAWLVCETFGDKVCDTPPTTGSFGCPSPAPLSCDGIRYELIENYMDYTYDACKSSFTPGQKSRMGYSILVYRSELISAANVINTGIDCASLSGLYANFDSDNFNGCVNSPMVFTSLNTAGFVYTWDFGDSTFATGVNGSHSYTSPGQYLVTLTATNTSLSISESKSMPVFVTACEPIVCGYNKWDFNYGYLDFSSGKPIATNHTGINVARFYADFYLTYYRADSMGQPLFHITGGPYTQAPLFDASFVEIDTLGQNVNMVITRCPGSADKFCVVQTLYAKVNYTILQTNNGTVTILPGKRRIFLPTPPNAQLSSHAGVIAVPNCDGSKFWILVSSGGGTVNVYELNSNDTVLHHQTYTVTGLGALPGALLASPDGRKIVLGATWYSGFAKFGFFVLNFDKSTGTVISNYFMEEFMPVNFNTPSYQPCFSPNSRYLYKQSYCCNASGSTTGYIYQYDLYNSNPNAAKKVITQFQFERWARPIMQLNIGPDKKIYIGYEDAAERDRFFRLGVINYPDLLDNGLNNTWFNPNGPTIKPANSPYSSGINAFGYSYKFDNHDAFGCHWKPNAPPSFSYYATNCFTYQFYSDDCYSHSWNFGDPTSGASNTSSASNPIHTFSGAGNYPVSLVINGETFTDTIRIALPPLQIIESGFHNCPAPFGNYSIVLPQTEVNYSWNITNGAPVYVASATEVDVQWDTTTSNGQIRVIAFNNVSGCSDSITLPVNFSVCTGISSIDEAASIFIHPNPAKENFLISSKSEYNGTLELKVTNMIGEVMETKGYYLNNEPLHILVEAKSFPKGIYLVMLKTKTRIVLKKVVKE